MTEPRRTRSRTDFVRTAEVALCGVTLATIATMWRLFEDGSFFVPLALHAIAAHVLAAALRRRGVAPATSALLCLIAAIAALTWGHLFHATTMGIPTGETARAAADSLDLAWRTFGDVRAPAPVLDGFLLSAGAAIWIGAWLADLAAFRLWTPFESLIPSGTLFLFASLFSADRARPLAAALWLAAACTFVLLHRCARQQSSPSWLGSDARAGTWALVKVGVAVTVGAVLVGSLVGPRLPGAAADPIVAVGAGEDGGSRTTVSPLVEIHRRLIEQSNVELFTVAVDDADRQYWRLTALDIFDGEIWSSRGSFGDADGRLGDGSDADLPVRQVTQTFTITGLAAIWLPAAFEASDIEVDDTEVRWDEVTSTLIVGRDIPTSDQLTYEVTSAVVDLDPTVLGNAAGEVPADVLDRDLSLPAAFPEPVRAEAQRIVDAAGAVTPYQRALALQNSFLDGSFTYSLEAPAGHSDSAIEDFLFNTRTGYCEQFSGTFAAMARSIGLPARVAVGFTPGDVDPTHPGHRIVRGEHAHAWPEVYIAGVGWVAFEPTPGRGAPGAEDYTGRPESQDTPGQSTDPIVTATPDPQIPDPQTGDPAAPVPAQTTVPGGAGTDPGAVTEEGSSGGFFHALRTVLLVVLGIVVLVGLAGGTVAGGRALRRALARSRATTPELQVEVAASEMTEALALVGLYRHRWETSQEFGNRVAAALRVPAAARIGRLRTRAEFDPAGLAEEDATEVQALAAEVVSSIHGRTPWWRRALAEADPRGVQQRAMAVRGRGTTPVGARIQILPALGDG